MTHPIPFGDWVWYPDTLELRNGARIVNLEPRVGRMLEYLLDHPGELLTHDHLVEAVWDGRVVSNEAIRRAVWGLRQALALDGSDSLIRTIHKKGYIAEFPSHRAEDRVAGRPQPAARVASVALLPDSPTVAAESAGGAIRHTASSRRLPILLGMALAAILVTLLWTRFDTVWKPQPATMDFEVPSKGPTTIAVLPFINLSQAADGEVLANGLAEELLGTLALNPELRVTARPSAFQFKEPDRDVRDVGQRLGVHYVLDGSVRNLGERVRVHTRLIDTRTGKQLWGDKYERSLADWFDLQQVVTAEVMRALGGVLQQKDKPPAFIGGTSYVEAHLEMLRARQLLATRSVADAEQAIDHLQRALLMDPDYALAYARLADAILIQAEATNRVTAVRPLVGPLLEKALTLDTGLGEAYCLRSLLTDDRAAAERDLRRGLELNPSYARGYELLAGLQARSPQKFQQAIETIDSAIALDPLTPGNHHAKAMLMMRQGNWEKAAELDRRALELSPNYRAALTQLSEVYAVEGHFADAIGYARRAVALDPRAVPMRNHLILLYLAVGDLELARAANNPPTPFGTWAIRWAEAGERQLVDTLYDDKPALAETIGLMVSSQLLLRQAVSDGDYVRTLALLSELLPTGDALPPEVGGWDLYAYANLSQLLKLSGDEAGAWRLQKQIEDRMAALEAHIPRHALISAQVRATLLARAGRSKEACDSLENAYTPNPRPYWKVILANPAFDDILSTPCFQSLRRRIDEHITSERVRIDASEQAGPIPDSPPASQDHGTTAAT